MLFQNNNTVWGLGNAALALGPDIVLLDTAAPQLTGQFYVYDSDYVDANNRGTLLAISDVVTVHQGDIWEFK